MLLSDVSISQPLAYGGIVLLLYTIYGAVYRLFFSSVAGFPGPKLAALTFWYEFYYDVIKRGRYTWKIIDLHKHYGPIVRINPYELHISDPDFYNELYPGPSKKTDKWAWSAKMFGNGNSVFGTVPHELHRMRRRAINPFFSKPAISRLEPEIQTVVDHFMERVYGFYESGQVCNVMYAFSALTADIIGKYCFAKSYGCLSRPDFAPDWYHMVDGPSELSLLLKQFGFLFPLLQAMPDWLTRISNPAVWNLILLRKDHESQIKDLKASKFASSSHVTIFQSLLEGDLPASERTDERLINEAQTLVAAGILTTANFLKITTYYIVANPHILQTLTAELDHAIPNPSNPPTSQALEKLPYLSAIIAEGHRLSCGVSHRLQRVAPDRGLRFNEWIIPAGTPVSMSSLLMHFDPNIFPSPHVFDPQRWLLQDDSEPKYLSTEISNDDQQPQSRRLDRYLVPFSKGNRACAGINLASTEIYLTLANLFRRAKLELVDVVRERDIDVTRDWFNAKAALESEGVKVKVVGWRD